MLSYKEFLEEVLIQFGGHNKFGQMVILAGGAGSGKGFVKANLLDIDGKVFDVDILKTLSLKSKLIQKRAMKEFGVDIAYMNLKNPENVSKLHMICKELGIANKREEAFVRSTILAHPDRKPNIIFDCTLQDISKLNNLAQMASEMGYDKKNIHIVWVLNDLDTAIAQNAERDRVVDVDILSNTHKHVSYQMKELISSGTPRIRKYMDGYFYIVFNKKFVDSLLKFSTNIQSDSPIGRKKNAGGNFVKSAVYYAIKERGKPMKSLNDISDDVLKRIQARVPDKSLWRR